MMKSRLILSTVTFAMLGLTACGGSSKAEAPATTTTTFPFGKCSAAPTRLVNPIVSNMGEVFKGSTVSSYLVPVPASEQIGGWPQYLVRINYKFAENGKVTQADFAVGGSPDGDPIVPVGIVSPIISTFGKQYGLDSPQGKWGLDAMVVSPTYKILDACK